MKERAKNQNQAATNQQAKKEVSQPQRKIIIKGIEGEAVNQAIKDETREDSEVKALQDQVKLLTMELERVRSADPAVTQALDQRSRLIQTNAVFRKMMMTLANAKQVINRITPQQPQQEVQAMQE